VPELPEVQTIAAHLHPRLAGRTVAAIKLTRTDIAHGMPQPWSPVLRRRTVHVVTRRGKRVILELDHDLQLVVHLGMSGRLTLTPRLAPMEPHTHMTIEWLGLEEQLRFRDPRRFGGVWLLDGRQADDDRPLAPLGPEPLTLTPKAFVEILSRRRQIKALLLDQRIIAGMGNIYCDESLHVAGIHPLTTSDRIDDVAARRLLRAIKSVLRSAIRSKGSTLNDYRTADGSRGAFQRRLRVYGRAGAACKTCAAPIRRIIAAGRSTHYCPNCQRPRRSRKRPTFPRA
jgi:formamidopyrimidine-DNA glycosylase